MGTPIADAPRFSPPRERIALPGGVALARIRQRRAASAVRAINESLEHLRPWMAWAAEPATEASVGTSFEEAELAWDEGRAFGYSIVAAGDDELVLGGCGLHGRLGPAGLEIGYWVHVDHAGRGIATEVARALTVEAFAVPGVERVRIQCEAANAASARVPAKLGFTLAGVVVPDEGTCEGRLTQQWLVERADWQGSVAR